jgi:hypothetical protein
MANVFDQKLNDFMAKIIAKNPSEMEFHQAVHSFRSSKRIQSIKMQRFLSACQNLSVQSFSVFPG